VAAYFHCFFSSEVRLWWQTAFRMYVHPLLVILCEYMHVIYLNYALTGGGKVQEENERVVVLPRRSKIAPKKKPLERTKFVTHTFRANHKRMRVQKARQIRTRVRIARQFWPRLKSCFDWATCPPAPRQSRLPFPSFYPLLFFFFHNFLSSTPLIVPPSGGCFAVNPAWGNC
jgi:hypothetical protein